MTLTSLIASIGGIGIAPVDDHLQRRRPSGRAGRALKLRPGMHHHQHLLAVDQRRDLALVGDLRHRRETGRAVEGGEQARAMPSRDLRCTPRTARSSGRRWRRSRTPSAGSAAGRSAPSAAALVFQQRQEFLDHQCEYASEHGRYSSRLRALRQVRPRKTAASITSASAFGRITLHTLPARNTVCRMAT